jgi:hypothetical protein
LVKIHHSRAELKAAIKPNTRAMMPEILKAVLNGRLLASAVRCRPFIFCTVDPILHAVRHEALWSRVPHHPEFLQTQSLEHLDQRYIQRDAGPVFREAPAGACEVVEPEGDPACW